MRRDDPAFDAACVEDFFQELRREAIAAKPEFLHGTSVALLAVADGFDRHLLIGRAEEIILWHMLADDGNDGAKAHLLAAPHDLHHARKMRIGLVIHPCCHCLQSLPCRGRNLGRTTQNARHGHQ